MSDRAAEARAEAARRNPGQSNISQMKREEFMRGWLAADANPKPHTTTRAELDEAATRFAEVGASPGPNRGRPRTSARHANTNGRRQID